MPYATGTRALAFTCFILCLIPPWIQTIVLFPVGLGLWATAKQKEREREQELAQSDE